MKAYREMNNPALPLDRRVQTGLMAHHSGAAAEDAVERDYSRRGHVVVQRRWRGSGGEIDLIVADGDGLIFVEVKKARTHASAAERVSPRQMGRIYASASEYLGCMPKGQLTDVRFDVALMDEVGRLDIIENAFAT